MKGVAQPGKGFYLPKNLAASDKSNWIRLPFDTTYRQESECLQVKTYC